MFFIIFHLALEVPTLDQHINPVRLHSTFISVVQKCDGKTDFLLIKIWYKQFEKPACFSKQDVLELATILHSVKMIVWSRELGQTPILFFLIRQALSSHPHQKMVWLYWLQDRESNMCIIYLFTLRIAWVWEFCCAILRWYNHATGRKQMSCTIHLKACSKTYLSSVMNQFCCLVSTSCKLRCKFSAAHKWPIPQWK
jgi:hypothetical protein